MLLAAAIAGCAATPVRAATTAPARSDAPATATATPAAPATRPPPQGPDGPITAAQRDATIDALLRMLADKYVFPGRATKAQASIRARRKRGEYDAITTGHALAGALTRDLDEVLHDAHFGVQYSAEKLPARVQADQPSAVELAEYAAIEAHGNGGFEKVERLPGNIGYLEVRSFAFPGRGYAAAAAAMAFLANTDALIIDLRRNGGGEPEMVAALSSYLFAGAVHLNDLYYRAGDTTRQYWTAPGVPGERYVDKPVFVLISERTGSAAEEFAYNLQQLKRATLIGGRTWGGANPGDFFRIGDHFEAFIPTGRAINPISKTNWEGVGVKPDIAVPADDALRLAQIKLLEQRISAAKVPELRAQMEKRLRELTRAP